jgi:uncharacterized DUF497 family protein
MMACASNDAAKAAASGKHGVSFDGAMAVFYDPLAATSTTPTILGTSAEMTIGAVEGASW